MITLTEKPKILGQFFDKSNANKSTFLQVQRMIWEKVLFPNRFLPCSVFLCSSCSNKTRDLSFCLQCGRTFCGTHYQEHSCPPGFGVDIKTRQLFLFSPEIGRRFVFDAAIDRLIISAKLGVIDGLPLTADLDSPGPILPIPRSPMPLHNLGNTCWMNSLLQCFVVNPLLQKWFLSSSYPITRPDCLESTIHLHLCRLFLAQIGEPCFSLADFLYVVWLLFPSFAIPEQHDTHEFFMKLRTTLDEFYQQRFETQVFGSIFSWRFKVIESCESCDEQKTYIENESDIILVCTNCSSMSEALSQFLRGSSPLRCNSCGKPCKRQYLFNSLPPTLTISLSRDRSADRSMAPIKLVDEINLDEFIDIDKKEELGEAKYSLIGMVVRPGSGDTGHYFANVKRWGKWFRCDDINIEATDVHNVLLDDACLLFFTRDGFIGQ